MIALPKPEVILTHESDLDGFLSACCSNVWPNPFRNEVPLEAYHYQAWKQRELRERSAWVADFTFEARLDKIDWVIIDHHPTDMRLKCAGSFTTSNKSAHCSV